MAVSSYVGQCNDLFLSSPETWNGLPIAFGFVNKETVTLVFGVCFIPFEKAVPNITLEGRFSTCAASRDIAHLSLCSSPAFTSPTRPKHLSGGYETPPGGDLHVTAKTRSIPGHWRSLLLYLICSVLRDAKDSS